MHTDVWDGQIVLSFWGKDLWYDSTHARTFWNPGGICLNGNSDIFPWQSTQQNICDPSRRLFSVFVAIHFFHLFSVHHRKEKLEKTISHTNCIETRALKLRLCNNGLTFYMMTVFLSRASQELHVFWWKQVYTGWIFKTNVLSREITLLY